MFSHSFQSQKRAPKIGQLFRFRRKTAATRRCSNPRCDRRPDNLKVFADSVGHFRVFLTSYKQMFLRQKLIFYVEDVKTKIKQHKNSIFLSGKE